MGVVAQMWPAQEWWKNLDCPPSLTQSPTSSNVLVKRKKSLLISKSSQPYQLENIKMRVLCDVMPMETTHILLGRPWQFDKNILHDELTNKISFTFQRHKITLKSLSPKEVNGDQVKVKEKRENEKKRVLNTTFSFPLKRSKK